MGLLAGLFLFRQLVFLNAFVLTLRTLVPLMPGGFAIFLFNRQIVFFLAFPVTEVNVFIPLVPVWFASENSRVKIIFIEAFGDVLASIVLPSPGAVIEGWDAWPGLGSLFALANALVPVQVLLHGVVIAAFRALPLAVFPCVVATDNWTEWLSFILVEAFPVALGLFPVVLAVTTFRMIVFRLASCGINVSVTVLRTLPVALVLRVVPFYVAVLVRFGAFIEVTVRNVALPVAQVFSFVPLVVTALSGCGFWFEQTIFDRTVPLASCPVEVVTFSWSNCVRAGAFAVDLVEKSVNWIVDTIVGCQRAYAAAISG